MPPRASSVGPAAPLLQLRHGFHGLVPPLVGVPPGHLAQDGVRSYGLPQLLHHLVVRVSKQAPRNAVGNDQRVYPVLPHDVLHVAADGGDRGGVAQPAPVDAVKGEGIVGVPEQHRVVPQPVLPENVADTAHHLGGVPLLSQDHHQLARGRGRLHHVVLHEVRDGLVEITELVLLAIVHAVRMVPADPLTPAVQDQLAVLPQLFSRAVGIADEEQVRGVTLARQRRRQVVHAHTEAAGRGVAVRTFKAQDHEDRVPGCDPFSHDR